MSDGPNLFGFSDAARRISDAANQAIVNGDRMRWMAFSLADGAVAGMPDNPRTYPHRADAVRAQGASDREYGYLQVPLDGVTPRAAEVFLKVGRQLRAAGMELTDPEVRDRDFPVSNLRESFPSLDRHRWLQRDRRSRGGLILP